MKFVALVSGGKDSWYSILLAHRAAGHELVGCVHLAAPNNNNHHSDESFMYQSAASEAVRCQVQDCCKVPYFEHVRTGTSLHTALVYSHEAPSTNNDNEPQRQQHQQAQQPHDEVHDMYQALRYAIEQLQRQNVTVEAVCCGAILSTYQRVRVEYVVCHLLQLSSLAYLWRKAPPKVLLDEMLQTMRVVLVKTAAPPGLQPHRHLGQSLADLVPHLQACHEKYQLQLCGEGGEYESLVLDCPALFQAVLQLDQTSIELDPHDDGVGTLRILACRAEPTQLAGMDETTTVDSTTTSSTANAPTTVSTTQTTAAPVKQQHTTLDAPLSPPPPPRPGPAPPTTDGALSSSEPMSSAALPVVLETAPLIRRVSGGLWSISELSAVVAPIDSADRDALVVVHQARQILATLDRALHQLHCTAHDVVMVHVYLADMADFARINHVYAAYFGTHVPPSRSTVAVPQQCRGNNCRLRLDCLVQCGSGEYLRRLGTTTTTTTTRNPYAAAALVAASHHGPLREVLHVQSRSHWAPTCVGPYSQVNTLRGAVHLLAGQIGLVPATMQLCSADWSDQLVQCWINVASVLDALNAASIEPHTLSCLVYLADSIVHNNNHAGTGNAASARDSRRDDRSRLASICRRQIQTNGGVIPGQIDGIVMATPNDQAQLYDGYEDEETRLAIEGHDDGQTDAGGTVHEAEDRIWEQSLCPILIVSIAQMPVGAVTEIELVAASRRAASCLGLSTLPHRPTSKLSGCAGAMLDNFDAAPLAWDAGHDFPMNPPELSNESTIQIDASFRALGRSGAKAPVASALVTAKLGASPISFSLDCRRMMNHRTIMTAMLTKLKEEKSFDLHNVLHIRFYYLVKYQDSGAGMDESSIRLSLYLSLGHVFTPATTPAVTVVPVSDMFTLFHNKEEIWDQHLPEEGAGAAMCPTLFALQALSIDPVHLEQSIWIHQER
jgi:diphthine-ammonia ligase